MARTQQTITKDVGSWAAATAAVTHQKSAPSEDAISVPTPRKKALIARRTSDVS